MYIEKGNPAKLVVKEARRNSGNKWMGTTKNMIKNSGIE